MNLLFLGDSLDGYTLTPLKSLLACFACLWQTPLLPLQAEDFRFPSTKFSKTKFPLSQTLVKCFGQIAQKACHVSLSKYTVSSSGRIISTALRPMEIGSQDTGYLQLHTKMTYLQFSEDTRSLQKGFSHHHFSEVSLVILWLCNSPAWVS